MNWEQLQTILWLRWRLMRNQWSRSGGLGAVMTVIMALGAVVLAAVGFAGGLVGGAFGLEGAKPSLIMLAWLILTVVFLFLWTTGLLTELQRSETIDLQKLMHLPAVLGQLFMVNYIVSHFSPSIVIMVPLVAGMTIGLAFSHGPQMLLLLPLALAMILMISAWTYCLRGWLGALMNNPRRRRTVIMCISLAFILIAQGPNLYFNVLGHRHDFHAQSRPGTKPQLDINLPAIYDQLALAQGFIPPLWVPLGAQDLAAHHVLTALYGTLGCLGLAALGLLRAYRNTIVAFQGGSSGKAKARPRPATVPSPAGAAPAQTRPAFLEWRPPMLPEQAAAQALATLRYVQRAPEVKMALASSIISMVILGAMFVFRAAPHVPDTAKPFVATSVVVFSVFLLVHFFANQFGFDRDGFRTLILSPVERRLILLGKNAAIGLVGLALAGIPLTVVTLWFRLPVLTMAASLLQLLTLLLFASVAGNLLSILVPYRMQPGSLKPTKMPGLAMLVMVLCQMILPLIMAPVYLAPLLDMLWRRAELPALVPVNLLVSALLCGAAAAIYALTLAPLGRLLQRRETQILSVVTVEVE
jgi:hypothetical protein